MMATREQLEKALRNADAAGDDAAARRIAAELKNMSAAPPQQQQSVGPIQALDDVLRLASNGLTFGFRDKLANYIGGGTPEEERAKTAQASERAGGAGTIAELGGAMVPAMLLPNLAPAALSRIGANAPVSRAIASTGIGALEGAALGGANAAGHDQDVLEGISSGALFGGAGTAAAGLLAKGGNALASMFGKNPSRLSVDDLRTAKSKAYRDVSKAGVEYTPQTVDKILKGMDDITSEAWPIRHPQTIGMNERVGKVLRNERTIQPRGAASPAVNTPLGPVPGPAAPGQKTVRRPVSLTRVDQTRQAISKNLAGMPDPAEAEFGRRFMNTIDETLAKVDKRGVTARSGNPEDGLDLLNNARQLNTRMRKLEMMDDTLTKAERRASRNLQAGEDTTIRANVESVLNNPKKTRGFTPDELDAMEKLVRGSSEQNLLRQMGRLAPGGGLSFGGAGFGAATGGAIAGTPGALVGAGIPTVTGILAKKASERSTRKAADDLLTLIASGGNAAAIRKPQLLNKDAEKMLARFFTQMGITDD